MLMLCQKYRIRQLDIIISRTVMGSARMLEIIVYVYVCRSLIVVVLP